MRKGILPAVGLTFLAASLAHADIPPPPDDYTGPQAATIAGLTFVHQELPRTIAIRDIGNDTNPFDVGGRFVILSDCVSGHPNCVLARKLGAIGGIVDSVDGTDPGADVAEVQKTFSAAGKKVKLKLIVQHETGGARTARTVSLTVNPR